MLHEVLHGLLLLYLSVDKGDLSVELALLLLSLVDEFSQLTCGRLPISIGIVGYGDYVLHLVLLVLQIIREALVDLLEDLAFSTQLVDLLPQLAIRIQSLVVSVVALVQSELQLLDVLKQLLVLLLRSLTLQELLLGLDFLLNLGNLII